MVGFLNWHRQLLDWETVKGSWPRESNCRGQLQAGLGAERLGWWRNRPCVSLKWDFADQREGHGFLDRKTDKKIPKETEWDQSWSERRRALAGGPIGVSVRDRRSVCSLRLCLIRTLIRSYWWHWRERTEGRELRERQMDPNKDIRQKAVSSLLWWTRVLLVLMRLVLIPTRMDRD